MVATVSVKVDTGGTSGTPGTSTDIDALGPPTLQFRTEDASTVDTAKPIVIPTSGTNYSYTKSMYLFCDTAPSVQIDNIQVYTDGSSGLGTGVGVVIGDQLRTKNSGTSSGYIPATGTSGTTGTEMTTFYTGVTTVTSFFTFTSASTKSITISETGSIINAIGETSNYFILQMTVGTTASPGTTSNETGTIQYDEI
jgi:hypothetical protein